MSLLIRLSLLMQPLIRQICREQLLCQILGPVPDRQKERKTIAATLKEILSPAFTALHTFSHWIYEALMPQLQPTEEDTEAGRLEPGHGAN